MSNRNIVDFIYIIVVGRKKKIITIEERSSNVENKQ